MTEQTFRCPVCLDNCDEEAGFTLGCPQSHRMCVEDCKRSIEIRLQCMEVPICPMCKDANPISEFDVEMLFGKGDELAKLHEIQHLNMHADDIPCPTPDCMTFLEIDTGNPSRLNCEKCQISLCINCKEMFHRGFPCAEVRSASAVWLSWQAFGRTDYLKKSKQDDPVTPEAHDCAVKDAIRRMEDLRRDEEWKAANLRLCPHCSRPVERIDGCNAMVCGRDASDKGGGNLQRGCGRDFSWLSAPRYVASTTGNPVIDRLTTLEAERARWVRHLLPGTRLPLPCDVCRADLRGPGFECVHCPARFTACCRCEPSLAAIHDPRHVFLIRLVPECPEEDDGPAPAAAAAAAAETGEEVQVQRALVAQWAAQAENEQMRLAEAASLGLSAEDEEEQMRRAVELSLQWSAAQAEEEQMRRTFGRSLESVQEDAKPASAVMAAAAGEAGDLTAAEEKEEQRALVAQWAAEAEEGQLRRTFGRSLELVQEDAEPASAVMAAAKTGDLSAAFDEWSAAQAENEQMRQRSLGLSTEAEEEQVRRAVELSLQWSAAEAEVEQVRHTLTQSLGSSAAAEEEQMRLAMAASLGWSAEDEEEQVRRAVELSLQVSAAEAEEEQVQRALVAQLSAGQAENEQMRLAMAASLGWSAQAEEEQMRRTFGRSLESVQEDAEPASAVMAAAAAETGDLTLALQWSTVQASASVTAAKGEWSVGMSAWAGKVAKLARRQACQIS